MSRIAPALLVCLLACTGPARADDNYPPLDQRVGKTITVVEKNQPTEKAVITQVWRLEDGSPVMQAKTLTSNQQMTLVENPKATTITDRIKVIRWTNGVRPEGCPVPPPAQAAIKQTQYSKPQQKEVAQPVATKSDTVVTTEGGLLPVLPKKEEAKPAPLALSQPPIAPPAVPMVTKTVKTEVATPAPVKVDAPLASTTVAVKQQSPAPAVIKTPAPAMPIQQPAVAAKMETAPGKPELIGGCEVITITENGVARKYMILGTARDKHGVMVNRCQALDTKEIVTLSCDSCKACATAAPCKPACPPAPVKCEPAKVVCAPAPAKVECKPCEPAKVACAPAKVECKPCEPVKVACEPAKTAAPCVTKACDPCADKKCAATACDSCGNGLNNTSCGLFCKHETLADRSARHGHLSHCASINVPVPGVRLATVNGMPGGPPPQPMIPAFCTMNSSSVRAYMNAPQLMPIACLYRPFSDGMNMQIASGMYQMNGVNGEAVANTLHLINVLSQSREWENRQWAADRLKQATLPTVRPYVEDALVAAVQTDRATPVKVAAIRTLASLNSTREDVVAMLSYAAMDEDPRIKEAASDALNAMAKAMSSMQQAAYMTK